MGGGWVSPGRVARLVECLAAGMNPLAASRAAGGSRREARREAVSARAGTAAAGASGRDAAVLGLIASGLPPYKAARAAGVSASVAYRLVRKMGGVSQTPCEAPGGGRYLSREERYEIARLRESGLSVRQVAGRLRRSPSTVSRELARNAGPRTGLYAPERAHGLARRRQRRPRASRLSRNPALRAAVQGMLDRRYSPEQASGRLKVDYP